MVSSLTHDMIVFSSNLKVMFAIVL